jgi:cell division protein FtsN
MKKLAVLGMGVCIALAFSSCKSSESAYKKAYEKAKQQELAEPQTTAPAEEVVTAPVEVKVVESAPAGMRQEKVTVVSGGTSLKTFSVVCGAYSVKANAEGVKQALVNEGYTAMVVYNAERNLYRVVIGTFDDRASAENLRDSFKAKHPSNDDFQKAWLLYSVN